MSEFTNQTVVISGATRGIGAAIAHNFLQAGAQVIGTFAGNTEAANRFKAEHSSFSTRLELVQCDVANEEQVVSLFADIERKYEDISILVNNAGIRRDAVMALMPADQWQQVIGTNLTGTYLMAKQAVLLMMKNKYGRIINITSPVAHLGFPGQTNYAASKAGQIALTKSLAKEVARKKITVNCVSPGFIATDFINALDRELLVEYKKMVPMQRFGTAQEVADAVLFLASSRATYITGAVLDVTGGL